MFYGYLRVNNSSAEWTVLRNPYGRSRLFVSLVQVSSRVKNRADFPWRYVLTETIFSSFIFTKFRKSHRPVSSTREARHLS